jgi:hypothetical protein
MVTTSALAANATSGRGGRLGITVFASRGRLACVRRIKFYATKFSHTNLLVMSIAAAGGIRRAWRPNRPARFRNGRVALRHNAIDNGCDFAIECI